MRWLQEDHIGRLFSLKGRINRRPYLLTTLAVTVLLKGLERAAENDANLEMGALPLYLLSLYVVMAAAVKRSHDVGRSGWFALLLFVPILNLWPGLTFAFAKGAAGPNEYGEDPLGAPPPRAG